MPRLYTLKYAKFSVCDPIFRVRIFSSTVASPIASLKCLRVGCAKRQKRENVCVHPPLEALQFYLMSRTNVTQNFRFFHNRVVFSGGASCVIKMLSRWGRKDAKAFALGTQRRENFRVCPALQKFKYVRTFHSFSSQLTAASLLRLYTSRPWCPHLAIVPFRYVH